MATDATGTPTSPDNIPTYNVSADAPSGLGFNAAMAAIQTALSARVDKPSGIASGEVPVWNGSTFARSSVTRIGPTSLGSGTPDATTFLRGDSSWQAVSSGATVATTIAGLGTASDGKIGLIRAGSSLYGEIPVIYDATKAKWVSPEYQIGIGYPSNATAAFTSDSPVAIAALPGWSALVTAGLSIEARMTVWVVSNQNNSFGGWKFAVGSQAAGSVSRPTNASGMTTLASSTTASTTETYVDTGWIAGNPASADHLILGTFTSATNTSQTQTSFWPTMYIRFVG